MVCFVGVLGREWGREFLNVPVMVNSGGLREM
jgi:hypothetical protein